MGGRTGILKVLGNTGTRLRVVPVLALPAYSGGPTLPTNPPVLSTSPSYSRRFIPARCSRDTHPKLPISPYRPFWHHYSANFYTLLPSHAVPVPDLPCLCQRSPRPAVLRAIFFSQGCALLSGSAGSSPAVLGPRSPRSLRRGSAAAGLRRRALCAVIGRDSVCRCRPMMERGGTGGPAPLGAGMRRRRSQRDSGSESPPSPPSNARLPAAAAASRGRWAAA